MLEDLLQLFTVLLHHEDLLLVSLHQVLLQFQVLTLTQHSSPLDQHLWSHITRYMFLMDCLSLSLKRS